MTNEELKVELNKIRKKLFGVIEEYEYLINFQNNVIKNLEEGLKENDIVQCHGCDLWVPKDELCTDDRITSGGEYALCNQCCLDGWGS